MADLSRILPAELDQLWLPSLQRAEHAQASADWYEARLAAGYPVPLSCLERSQTQLRQSRVEQLPYSNEWERRGGWRRVWVDAQGDLHSGQDCAATRCPDGEPQLLPALSGWSAEQVIQHGRLAVCLECFPEARRHPAWMSERAAQSRKMRCNGSARRPQGDPPRCSVCDCPAQLTKAGRVRAHPKP